jgi:hypothetical protein
MIKMLVNYKKTIMVVGFTLLCFVLFSGKASAAPVLSTNTFPNPNTSTQPLYMTLGRGEFESSLTGVAITTTTTGTYTATINEATFCNVDSFYGGNEAPDLPNDDFGWINGGFKTNFAVIRAKTGALEPSTNLADIIGFGQTDYTRNCINRSISFTFQVTAGDLRPELQNQYLVFFAALVGEINPFNLAQAQENSFSVTITGPGTARVLPVSNTMNYSNRSRDPATSGNIELYLDFALACGSGTITTTPRFFDLDIGDPSVQPNNMTIQLDKYNRTTNALVSTIVSKRNLVGGDGTWNTIPGLTGGTVTVDDDHWYRATIIGLYYNNAFTYSLGVDYSVLSNIHAYDQCNSPPTVSVVGTANCETFTISVNDVDGDAVDIALQVNGTTVTGAGSSAYNLVDQTANNTQYTFSTEDWRDFNARNFRVVVDDGNGGIAETSNQSVGPCVRMNCEGITLPATLEVNRPFSATASFRTKRNYGTPAERDENLAIQSRGIATTYAVNIFITPPAGGPANPVVTGAVLNATTSGNQLSHTISGYIAPAMATDLVVTYSLDSPNNNADISCPSDGSIEDINVAQIPYVQSFRGDIIAGYGIKDTEGNCSTNDSMVRSSVDTALAPNNAEIIGSGTQMVVFARGVVNGFRSAITDTEAGINTAPWVRIFANTTGLGNPRTATSAIGSGDYGGRFISSLCAENWFNEIDQVTMNNTSAVDLAGERGIRGYSNGTSPVRLTASGEIVGSRKIFIEGDAIIGDSAGAVNQAIRYGESWSSVVDIPSLIIIATGNIYIDENITNLDGVYVARGTVFTCSPTGGISLPSAGGGGIDDQLTSAQSLAGSKCYSVPLTLRGAMVADSVRLWRTGGTLSKAIVGGVVVDARARQAYAPGLTGSETFILPPEVYLAPRFGEVPTNGGTGQKQLDSLISLPPPF